MSKCYFKGILLGAYLIIHGKGLTVGFPNYWVVSLLIRKIT